MTDARVDFETASRREYEKHRIAEFAREYPIDPLLHHAAERERHSVAVRMLGPFPELQIGFEGRG